MSNVSVSLVSLAIIVRGKVRLSRLMETSVGRGCGRCEGSGEKGAHEQAMMRSWKNAWAAWMVLDAVMVLGVFRCDAPWSRGWRADGGNERNDDGDDRQACVSDGCGARRMQLGRWWGWWRCWLRRWLWQDSESPGGMRSNSQWWMTVN